MIPVTCIVVTKNEGENLAHCLLPLITRFVRVIVVDSGSTDDTMTTAKSMGADFVPYAWNGKYPKKRQWCLENIYGLGQWVFFVDADEVVSHELLREMQVLFARGKLADGYFVRGRYVWMNKILRFGLTNNKLCLFRRDKFHFPPVDDLAIPGMGEIEGHYQPVPIDKDASIGQLDHTLIHHNHKGRGEWNRRHQRYAQWEAGMTLRGLWPIDPIPWREELKSLTRASVLRPALVFIYSYFLRAGFLDGIPGFDFALARAKYASDVHRRIHSLD